MNRLKRLLLPDAAKPRLSLIVVVYDMPEQARKTLQSLCTPYQRGVSANEYEVIVVENSSERPLGKSAALACGDNVRYFHREETLPSPVPAARFGVEKARGNLLGLMIDGARMASPGLVDTILRASLTDANAVVAVPGYHLGRTVQQEAMSEGYDQGEEALLLESIAWPGDGYRLFDIACFSRSGAVGFFRPNAESNCICMPRHIWDAVGGFDPAFTETGGGQANPDLYKRVCEHPGVDLIITPGEGTFHQFHGGVTTGTPPEERKIHMKNHFAQYRALRGESYSPPNKTARLYGSVPVNAMRFLQRSLERVQEAEAERHQD
jgi:hypothetical protein